MGFSPRDVDRMDWWQFCAAERGWRTAHGAKPKSGSSDLSDDELREMEIEGF